MERHGGRAGFGSRLSIARSLRSHFNQSIVFTLRLVAVCRETGVVHNYVVNELESESHLEGGKPRLD